MQELRSLCYVPGQGTWRTCQIRLFANAPGELETYDKDIVPVDSSGKPAGFCPRMQRQFRRTYGASHDPWKTFRNGCGHSPR